MQQILHKFKVLLLSGHTEFAELFLGFLGIVWGIWGLVLGTPSSRVIIDSHVGSIVWSLVLLLSGIYTSFCAVHGGRSLRRISTFLNMIIWGSVSILFFIESPTLIFWATYGLLFTFSTLLHIRTRFRGIEKYEPIK